MTDPTLRVGIMGTASIARKIIRAIKKTDKAQGAQCEEDRVQDLLRGSGGWRVGYEVVLGVFALQHR